MLIQLYCVIQPTLTDIDGVDKMIGTPVRITQGGVGVTLVMFVVEAHPLNLVALLQGLSKLVHGLVGQGTFCLEPHALHLV